MKSSNKPVVINADIEILPSKIEDLPHNRYHRNALCCASKTACWIVLTGSELHQKKIEAGHGNWIKWVKDNCEFSQDTAERYMAVYDGVKSKAMKASIKGDRDSLLALLEKPSSQILEEERANLLEFVHKVTDGETLNGLYREFGIVKKPSKGTGGDTGGRRAVDPNSPDVLSELMLFNPLMKIISEDWDCFWIGLSDAHMEMLQGHLSDKAKQLREAIEKRNGRRKSNRIRND